MNSTTYFLEIVFKTQRGVAALGRATQGVTKLFKGLFSLNNLLKGGLAVGAIAFLTRALNSLFESGNRLYQLEERFKAIQRMLGKESNWNFTHVDTLINKLTELTNVNRPEWLEVANMVAIQEGFTSKTKDTILILSAALRPLARSSRMLSTALIRFYQEGNLKALESMGIFFDKDLQKLVDGLKEAGNTDLMHNILSGALREKLQGVIGSARAGAGAWEHAQGGFKDMLGQLNKLGLIILAPVFEFANKVFGDITEKAIGAENKIDEYRRRVLGFIEGVWARIEYYYIRLKRIIAEVAIFIDNLKVTLDSIAGIDIWTGGLKWKEGKPPTYKGYEPTYEDFAAQDFETFERFRESEKDYKTFYNHVMGILKTPEDLARMLGQLMNKLPQLGGATAQARTWLSEQQGFLNFRGGGNPMGETAEEIKANLDAYIDTITVSLPRKVEGAVAIVSESAQRMQDAFYGAIRTVGSAFEAMFNGVETSWEKLIEQMVKKLMWLLAGEILLSLVPGGSKGARLISSFFGIQQQGPTSETSGPVNQGAGGMPIMGPTGNLSMKGPTGLFGEMMLGYRRELFRNDEIWYDRNRTNNIGRAWRGE